MNRFSIIALLIGLVSGYLLTTSTLQEDYIADSTKGTNKKTLLNLRKKFNSNQKEIKLLKSENRGLKLKLTNLQTKLVNIGTDIHDSRIDPLTLKVSTNTPKLKLTPEEIESRLKEVKELLPILVKNKDGKGLLELLGELKQMGELAYPQIVHIADLISRDTYQNNNSFMIKLHELENIFPQEIFVWALSKEQFDQVGPSFRVRAYNSLVFSQREDIDKILVNSFLKENTRWAMRRLSRILGQRPDEITAIDLIQESTGANKFSKEKRVHLDQIIFNMPGIEVDEYLEDRLKNSKSPKEKMNFTYYKNRRHPPESGYLIRNVRKIVPAKSTGIQKGDIIISYAGISLNKTRLGQAKRKSQGKSKVEIIIKRGSKIIKKQIKSGYIGLDGSHIFKED